MLKRNITYVNFNDEEVTEEAYFNLTKAEVVEMELSSKEGLSEMLQRIVKTEDRPALIREFKNIILMSYGEKSEDGKRFIKSQKLRDEFAQSAAYDQLFTELITTEQVVADFIIGVLPKDLQKLVQDASPQDSPKGLPPTARPPMPPGPRPL